MEIEQKLKAAVSGFLAARVGHNQERKSRATKKLARVAANFLNSGRSTDELSKMLLNEK